LSSASVIIMTATAPATIVYSDAPARTVNVSTLSSSRFLLPRERRLPFRDALGRVNIHLVNRCLREAAGRENEEVVTKLWAWKRHAQRALDARPEDENLTLDQLCANETVCVGGHDDSDAEREPPGTVSKQRRSLLRPPEPDDEPTADRAHLARCAEQGQRGKKKRRVGADAHASGAVVLSTSSSDKDDDDVYEVEEIKEEDSVGGRGFLIRWLGWGPAHDSWEPEEHLAPELVASFREERAHKASHVGSDYLAGRKRMLWCASCAVHMPSDSFSANMRRADPATRSCLNHHYKTTPTPGTLATPDRRRATRHVAKSAAASPLPPPPPNKAPRPSLSRSLSSRGAAAGLDVTSPVARLFQDK